MTDSKVPVYAITSTVAVATFYYFGPESMGGKGDLSVKLKAIEHLDAKEKHEEAQRVCTILQERSNVY